MNGPAGGSANLLVEPIGFVRTDAVERVDAPRQPAAATDRRGRIELLPGRNFEHALDNLAEWPLIWVIFWFHLNAGWRPKVLPPRSTSGRKGVFATRAPHRPNPIGLSAVRLERVEGLTLHIRDVDMVDGTPVLDLKPYVAYSDAHPAATSGWLDPGRMPSDPGPDFEVRFDPLADAQAAWIESRTGFELSTRIRTTLALGPEPHPYRRIRRDPGGLTLAVKEWRVRFSVLDREIRVHAIRTGYRPTQLSEDGEPFATHRAFRLAFPADD